ncbi:MAG TPA: hypothetical protein VLH08_05290 [Acidobacteriota bacterium]|nr:hypothetical protein [Acidobacteriota bacterium]
MVYFEEIPTVSKTIPGFVRQETEYPGVNLEEVPTGVQPIPGIGATRSEIVINPQLIPPKPGDLAPASIIGISPEVETVDASSFFNLLTTDAIGRESETKTIEEVLDGTGKVDWDVITALKAALDRGDAAGDRPNFGETSTQ